MLSSKSLLSEAVPNTRPEKVEIWAAKYDAVEAHVTFRTKGFKGSGNKPYEHEPSAARIGKFR